MIEEVGLGWKSSYKSGKAGDAITSGLEVVWTSKPTEWSHLFFDYLFRFEWELTKSPAGAHQWVAINADAIIPDPFDKTIMRKPTMLTTDLSLRFDPVYEKISRRFLEHPEEFEKAFARAWFKLTHRDMGPIERYLGPEVPEEPFIWQDRVPEVNHPLVETNEVNYLKDQILNSGLSISELVKTAWASASTFRGSDKRGGANGARVRLAPQKDWVVNQPQQLQKVLSKLEEIQQAFNQSQAKGKKISLADLIVLAGNTAVEQAARKGGVEVDIPFFPGRTDATVEITDIDSFKYLEPKADPFRNYKSSASSVPTEVLLIDKAQLLTLTAPELTVLVGGMRSLGANYDDSKHGVFTDRVDTLSNDFFKVLLSMDVQWSQGSSGQEFFEGRDRKTGALKYSATRADLIFASNSELRAVAEVYGSSDADQKFIKDFAKAWNKVMNLDRFDLK